MQSKSTLGLILALTGINGITFSLYSFFMAYITGGFLIATTIFACILLFTGIFLLRDRHQHHPDH